MASRTSHFALFRVQLKVPLLQMTTATDRLSHYKILLDDAEDQYSFALARGDWEQVSFYQKQIHKMRSEIGRIIKKQMGLS